jgi:hypothetical protein
MLLSRVGLPVRFQQMPRAFTEPFPALVIFPPQDAVVAVTLITLLVVSIGNPMPIV